MSGFCHRHSVSPMRYRKTNNLNNEPQYHSQAKNISVEQITPTQRGRRNSNNLPQQPDQNQSPSVSTFQHYMSQDGVPLRPHEVDQVKLRQEIQAREHELKLLAQMDYLIDLIKNLDPDLNSDSEKVQEFYKLKDDYTTINKDIKNQNFSQSAPPKEESQLLKSGTFPQLQQQQPLQEIAASQLEESQNSKLKTSLLQASNFSEIDRNPIIDQLNSQKNETKISEDQLLRISQAEELMHSFADKSKQEDKLRISQVEQLENSQAHVELENSQVHVELENSQAHVELENSHVYELENSQVHVELENSQVHVELENSQVHVELENSQAHVELENSQAHVELKNSLAHAELENSQTFVELHKSVVTSQVDVPNTLIDSKVNQMEASHKSEQNILQKSNQSDKYQEQEPLEDSTNSRQIKMVLSHGSYNKDHQKDEPIDDDIQRIANLLMYSSQQSQQRKSQVQQTNPEEDQPQIDYTSEVIERSFVHSHQTQDNIQLEKSQIEEKDDIKLDDVQEQSAQMNDLIINSQRMQENQDDLLYQEEQLESPKLEDQQIENEQFNERDSMIKSQSDKDVEDHKHDENEQSHKSLKEINYEEQIRRLLVENEELRQNMFILQIQLEKNEQKEQIQELLNEKEELKQNIIDNEIILRRTREDFMIQNEHLKKILEEKQQEQEEKDDLIRESMFTSQMTQDELRRKDILLEQQNKDHEDYVQIYNQDAIEEREVKIAEAKEQIEKLISQLEQFQIDAQTSTLSHNIKVQFLEDENLELKEQVANLSAQTEDQEQQIDFLNSDIQQTKQRFIELEMRKEDLLFQNNDLLSQIEQLQAERDSLQGDNNQLRGLLEQQDDLTSDQKNEMVNNIDQLHDLVQQKNGEILLLSVERDTLRVEYADLLRNLQEMEQRLENLQEEFQISKQQQIVLQIETEELKKNMKSSQKREDNDLNDNLINQQDQQAQIPDSLIASLHASSRKLSESQHSKHSHSHRSLQGCQKLTQSVEGVDSEKLELENDQNNNLEQKDEELYDDDECDNCQTCMLEEVIRQNEKLKDQLLVKEKEIIELKMSPNYNPRMQNFNRMMTNSPFQTSVGKAYVSTNDAIVQNRHFDSPQREIAMGNNSMISPISKNNQNDLTLPQTSSQSKTMNTQPRNVPISGSKTLSSTPFQIKNQPAQTYSALQNEIEQLQKIFDSKCKEVEQWKRTYNSNN